MKHTLIFDLDGTLLDSIEDIGIGMNKVLKARGYKEFEMKRYKEFVGGGVDFLVRNVMKALQTEFDIKQISREFIEVYETALHDNTKPYEGINELLQNLKGQNLGVLSNKPHELTRGYISKFFGDAGFTQVYGQRENEPKKPDPKVARDIAKSFDVKCENVYFIGDSDVDMKTAKNANMKAIGVLWGFRNEKELRENGADFIVAHPREILEILGK